LLSRAQEGELTDPGDAADAILAAGIFPLEYSTPAWLYTKGYLSEEAQAKRARFQELYEQERDEFLRACLRPWLIEHLAHPEDLLGSRFPFRLWFADDMFVNEAYERMWDHNLIWSGAPDEETGRPKRRPHAVQFTHGVVGQRDPRLEMLEGRRQQLRWIWILCEGLRREPVMMRSVDHQTRITRRHIVHGGQTHADALNELAGQLVHPPEAYVAHVRLPGEYHLVKLRPPPEAGGAGGHERLPDPNQPDDIRTRSRALYDVSRQEEEVLPAPSTEPVRRRSPAVTRFPRNDNPTSER
jgi:hypothetical protein